MNIDQYQVDALKTAVFPQSKAVEYLSMGMAGEAGEVLNKLKKRVRGDSEFASDAEVAKELGDVLWYVAVLANKMGYNLSKVASMNLDKLRSRKDQQTIKGTGDYR